MRNILLAVFVLFPGLVFALYAQSDDPIKRFTILHTNDEHAAFVPKPQSEYGLPGAITRGGIARVATVIQNVRREKAASDEQVLVLNAGDFISGSPFSWLILADEAPEIELMIAAGYDVLSLGNHEFDYGPDRLASYLSVAGYPERASENPVMATNTVIPDGHPLGNKGLHDVYIRELDNGLRIGIFGLVGKHAADVAPMSEPVTFADQHETARNAVQKLKDLGADIIVLTSHSGTKEEVALAKAVAGIDIIIGGHSHEVHYKPIVVQSAANTSTTRNSTIIVQTGTEFQYIGKLELAFNTETGGLQLLNMPDEASDETYLIKIDASIAEDSRILSMVDAYSTKLNGLITKMTDGNIIKFNQIIARSDEIITRLPELAESPLGNLVTDAMSFAAEKATGDRVDVVFEASGVIRGDLVPGRHPDNYGAVSFYDIASLVGLGSGPDSLPGYPMVSVYLTGEEIRRVLEITVLLSELMGSTYFLQNAGLRVEYDPQRAFWLRIPFSGTPVPSGRSVLRASLFTGEGRQTTNPDDFTPLKRRDENLYHVVSDLYNASFLPMLGEYVPSLSLVIKDKFGQPADINDRIIHTETGELKVWAAVSEYVMNQPQGDDGLAVIDPTYATVEGRMEKVEGAWLLFWPLTAFGITIVLLFYTFLHFRRRRNSR